MYGDGSSVWLSEKVVKEGKFSKKEWENFTEESTRHAVAELASSPKFTDWIIKHADSR
ncbi:hypothetical protein CsSME_00046258 [Camellia sinensis var. sinensis]